MQDVMTRGAGPSVLLPRSGLLRALWRRWQKWRMASALEALDDATLKDIGLYRGDIASVTRAHFPDLDGL